jgi:HSP20 family protein
MDMALPVRRRSTDVGRWDPFAEFEDLYDRMGRLLDGRIPEAFTRQWVPAVDLEETDDAFLVEVELPGVKREDIAVNLQGDELSVTGEVKERERAGLVRRQTRRTGAFEYRVTLPAQVRGDNVDARLEDGVLHVRLPKAESPQRRQIEVKPGA